jgi:protein involved in polysaccharide export with SLBB domain
MAARYRPGDRVRIRIGSPPGHFRTPAYIQGKTGVVAAVHGAFPNPESLAYGGDGLPEQVLYQIRFEQPQVWEHYRSAPQDKLFIDIYEHWLEPA